MSFAWRILCTFLQCKIRTRHLNNVLQSSGDIIGTELALCVLRRESRCWLPLTTCHSGVLGWTRGSLESSMYRRVSGLITNQKDITRRTIVEEDLIIKTEKNEEDNLFIVVLI